MNAYHWDLFWMLTRTEFRMRDQGTWAGFLWTLLHPLFIFAILYGLFTHWMSPHVDHYAAYLLIGVIQWNFFATATAAGLTSLLRKAGLVSHYSFPKVLVALSSVFAVLMSHLLEWAVLLGALLLMGLKARLGWFLLPGLILVELSLAAGISCFLSVAIVHMRDLDRVWNILLYGLFFLTPVFYTGDVLGPVGRRFVAANPVGTIIEATRGVVIGGGLSSLGGLLPVAVAAAALCAAGTLMFGRMSRGIVEKL